MENHKHREKETMQLQNSQRTTGISKSMHAYLQSPVQLFATTWTLAHQASLSMGFFRQENWSRLPCPPSGDLRNPGIKPASPALQEDSLLLSHRESL